MNLLLLWRQSYDLGTLKIQSVVQSIRIKNRYITLTTTWSKWCGPFMLSSRLLSDLFYRLIFKDLIENQNKVPRVKLHLALTPSLLLHLLIKQSKIDCLKVIIYSFARVFNLMQLKKSTCHMKAKNIRSINNFCCLNSYPNPFINAYKMLSDHFFPLLKCVQ